MPDQITAHITIGGRIPGHLVQELCELICQEEVRLDWGGDAFNPGSKEDLLAALNADGNHLCLYADQADWGEFSSLEPFLQEHQIAFDRHHDAKYDIISTILFYRPEQGRLEFVSDEREEVMCHAKPILPVVKMLAQAKDEQNRGRNQKARFLIDECLQRLQEHLPPEISPLPPFEIV